MARVPEREDIPDSGQISRWVWEHMLDKKTGELLWEPFFEFRKRSNQCESVIWRKYARSLRDVHQLGCAEERRRRVEGHNSTYKGATTAGVGSLRDYQNPNGHGFSVNHEPSESQWHAEVCYRISVENALTAVDKAELRQAAFDHFSDFRRHVCT